MTRVSIPPSRRSDRLFIAGAGPVGLTAALELHRRGFRTRLVDPRPAPVAESRALAVNARTLDLLEPSGATEALLAAGHRVRSLLIRDGARPLACIRLERLTHRFNFLLIVPQSDTERLLEATLRHQGGRIERGLALESFREDEHGLALRLDDGSEDRAEWLIAADGAHSSIRKSLGLGFPGESEPQHFGLADVELTDWPFPWDQAVVTLSGDGLAGFIPIREGIGRFIGPRPDILAVLPPEARVRHIAWQTDFRISYRQAATYQKGHVFLTGDAAHIHSPVGGRGMNLGIEDACWLAWLVEQGRTAEYTALRHAPGAAVLRGTELPTSIIASRQPFARLLRRRVVPFIANRPWVQRLALPSLAGLDTPPAPWLDAPTRA